jgi:hypothetical protein
MTGDSFTGLPFIYFSYYRNSGNIILRQGVREPALPDALQLAPSGTSV